MTKDEKTKAYEGLVAKGLMKVVIVKGVVTYEVTALGLTIWQHGKAKPETKN